MKTKWGTCNIAARRLWLNLELAKKPIQCLEYILVHELLHLIERHHNDRFRSLMDQYLPQWQAHRDECWDYWSELSTLAFALGARLRFPRCKRPANAPC